MLRQTLLPEELVSQTQSLPSFLKRWRMTAGATSSQYYGERTNQKDVFQAVRDCHSLVLWVESPSQFHLENVPTENS